MSKNCDSPLEISFCGAVPDTSELTRFTPDEIQMAMDKNLAAGLRQLADALDAGAIDGHCIDCNGHGFTRKGDDRAHLMLRIDLAAPIKQTKLQEGNFK